MCLPSLRSKTEERSSQDADVQETESLPRVVESIRASQRDQSAARIVPASAAPKTQGAAAKGTVRMSQEDKARIVSVPASSNGKDTLALKSDNPEKMAEDEIVELCSKEATPKTASGSTERKNRSCKGVEELCAGSQKRSNLVERAKYQFEADSEDEETQNEIDRNLEELSGATKRLNTLAAATGPEVEQQNRLIDESIADRSDSLDVPIYMSFPSDGSGVNGWRFNMASATPKDDVVRPVKVRRLNRIV